MEDSFFNLLLALTALGLIVFLIFFLFSSKGSPALPSSFKLERETWREAVIRSSKPYGLTEDCLAIFDRQVANKVPENQAAWQALFEWDCLPPEEIYPHLSIKDTGTEE